MYGQVLKCQCAGKLLVCLYCSLLAKWPGIQRLTPTPQRLWCSGSAWHWTPPLAVAHRALKSLEFGVLKLAGNTHVTGSHWPRLMPAANTWCQFLTFIILIGTSHQALSNILPIYNTSGWKVFETWVPPGGSSPPAVQPPYLGSSLYHLKADQ
jgi:hypothetical protein